MIIETLYSKNIQDTVNLLLIVPHGADASTFQARFPQLFQHFFDKGASELLRQYLRIEQDFGAKEIAHSIASYLYRHSSISSRVLELAYPRGLLDGGRQESHCLREFLPKTILSDYGEELKDVHRASISYVKQQLGQVRDAGGIFLDVHTMAPFAAQILKEKNPPEPDMQTYTHSYIQSEVLIDKKRNVDLITADGTGGVLADVKLTKCIYEQVSQELPCQFNEPYAALPHFMMHEYLQTCPGLAFDVPKDLLFSGQIEDFILDGFPLCRENIKNISSLFSEGVLQFFKS